MRVKPAQPTLAVMQRKGTARTFRWLATCAGLVTPAAAVAAAGHMAFVQLPPGAEQQCSRLGVEHPATVLWRGKGNASLRVKGMATEWAKSDTRVGAEHAHRGTAEGRESFVQMIQGFG